MVKGIEVEGNTSALNLLPEGNKIQTKSTDNDNNKNNNLNMLKFLFNFICIFQMFALSSLQIIFEAKKLCL